MNEDTVAEVPEDDREKVHTADVKEHSEIERFETAAEHLSQFEQLRPEVWSGMSERERELALQSVGRSLTAVYESPAPPMIGSRLPEGEDGVLLGEYSDADYLTRMNEKLFTTDNPDTALETYCHEFRHAYQNEMAQRYNSAFRHLCHDEGQAAEWANNLNGHYITFDQDAEAYARQPVERDANEFAMRLRQEVRDAQAQAAADGVRGKRQ